MPEKSKSEEIYLTRIYDAPVTTVWDAWTDPEKVARWWGPRGFTVTTQSKDLRPGGYWHYTMHGPDGADCINKAHYLEVERCTRLVYDQGGSEESTPVFRVTVLFSEVEGKTKMNMTMRCASPEAADETRRRVKKANGESTWDRLAELVESPGRETFVINQTFAAPIELMFDMWTDPQRLTKWLPPTRAEMRLIRSEPKPGGSSFYVMTGAFGTLYGRTEYQRVDRPHLIVSTQQFCDENEKVSRHPMEPNWPETMLRTVILEAEGPSHTRVTIKWEPLGTMSPEELETFIQGRTGMTQGWTASFDKLEALLDPAV